MPTNAEYEATIRKLKWPGLQKLWADIKAGTVDPWWPRGKAFEYLVVRMFELDKAQVTWPYAVHLSGGTAQEQIDGAMRFGGLHWLVESKDEDDTIAITPARKIIKAWLATLRRSVGAVRRFCEASLTRCALLSGRGNIDPIAKLRNQMLRRPWGTIGLVFTSTKFTEPAVLMTHFALPQPLLLWTGAEVEHALHQKKICIFALEKYRMCVEHGKVDVDITDL